jgi:hypothetical protein
MWPAAWHRVGRSASNRVEADHAQLKRRRRPMRGIKTMTGLRVLAAGHAFVQNLMGTRQATATGSPGASPSAEIAGVACRIHAYAEQCTRMPWRRSAGSGAHGGGGLVPGDPQTPSGPDPTVTTWAQHQPPPPRRGVRDTPGRVPGNRPPVPVWVVVAVATRRMDPSR